MTKTFIIYDDAGIIWSGQDEDEGRHLWSTLGSDDVDDDFVNATWGGDLCFAQVLEVRN